MTEPGTGIQAKSAPENAHIDRAGQDDIECGQQREAVTQVVAEVRADLSITWQEAVQPHPEGALLPRGRIVNVLPLRKQSAVVSIRPSGISVMCLVAGPHAIRLNLSAS